MKTSFRPRNDPYRRHLIALALILAGGGLVLAFLRPVLFRLAGPVWQGRAEVVGGTEDFLAYFKSKATLETQNKALQAELLSNQNLIEESRAVEASRESLLEAFGRTASSSGIAAAVLVHPPEDAYDMLILDAGVAEGVAIGDTVHLPEGGSVGTVSEVYAHTAKVTLFTSNGVRTAALLERGDVAAELVGQGGGMFEVDLPRQIPAIAGDRVLAPDITGELLGVVKDVSSAPTDSTERVLVQGLVNVHSVRYLFITH